MKTRPTIVVVDYGVGNLYSLTKALRRFDATVVVSEEAGNIEKADGVILPGVGAFEAGMRGLLRRNLVDVVKAKAAAGTPLLGICLGVQILLTEGHEFGIFEGLGIIPGRVVHFPPLVDREKVPHVGWNAIAPLRGASWDGTIFDGMTGGEQVYFVHSYIMEPVDPSHCLAETVYGGHAFCSAVRKGNIFGTQFHPEKSGTVGAKILENFVQCTILSSRAK
ncbi:MAG: imidazole glycerol phosphate synthase subunit HisH [Patescibacteria group bacterium]